MIPQKQVPFVDESGVLSVCVHIRPIRWCPSWLNSVETCLSQSSSRYHGGNWPAYTCGIQVKLKGVEELEWEKRKKRKKILGTRSFAFTTSEGS
jgi:hypothetical protein